MPHYVDMSYFIERDLHPALAAMGKLPWVKFSRATKDEKLATAMELNHTIGRKFPELAEVMKVAARHGPNVVLELITISRLLAFGPKLFEPDYDTCLSLEQIDIDIPFTDYQQPYPALIIRFPDRYVQHMHERFPNTEPFHTLTVLHEEGVLHIHQYGGHGQQDSRRPGISTTVNIANHVHGDTIEQFISNHESSPDFNFVEHLQRVSLNFCLLATHCGVRLTGPLDPRAARRSRKARERFGIGDIQGAVLDKPIRLYRTEGHLDRVAGEGSHLSPSTHWRRGHWRMQAHGPKHTLRKRIFIECVLVMESRQGDQPPPHATYTME